MDREEESQSDDYQYDFIDDNIEYDMYEGEETLPPPEVSSIRTRELEEPKVNLGKLTAIKSRPTETMNRIISFRTNITRKTLVHDWINILPTKRFSIL